MQQFRAGIALPRPVHRDDAPLGIEQGDVRGQRVQDGGLPDDFVQTQLLLRVLQQERPAVTVRHGIHLAGRQFLQALPGPVQHLDQRGNFLSHIAPPPGEDATLRVS